MFYDFGPGFYIDIKKAKTPSRYVYKGKKYRISIISDVLIRFEYSNDGKFSDYPTLFAKDRSFGKPSVKVKEDESILVISNDVFMIEYKKESPYVGTKLVPDANLRVTINGTEKVWYFNHPEARNFKGSSYSLDDTKGRVKYDNGLFSLDGFVSIDDAKTPILTNYGNIISSNYKNIDTYLFIYNNDFGKGLKDYFNLTGFPSLIPRYALGVWWYKDEIYNERDIYKLVNNFKENNIPLSVIMLGDKARNNFGTNISFSVNRELFPFISKLSKDLHDNDIRLGLNIRTNGIISKNETNYNNFINAYGSNKGEDIPFNVFDYKLCDSFLKNIINPVIESGVDFLWVDDNNSKSKLMNYTTNYYLYKNFSKYKDKRNFIISRNNGVCAHNLGALYSGNTPVSFKTLRLLPFYNSTSSNIGISWWSHDIGGFKGGSEDEELYIRYVQLGTYSPILRLSSESGKYYKREPWKWDAKTNKIAGDYLRIRQKLIPYIYTEAYKYSTNGSPIVQPLYYRYPETYDEPLYKNEYYFGSSFFICPITNKKDNVMNRVVHKIFLPNGIWYDFKTGKKFVGGKRYTTFYKDEDYPVYASSGAIIPMARNDNDNLNSIKPPETLEVQIFPGKSNAYKLYEDDGVSNMYKDGYSFTTQIEYFYKENDFSVQITPLEGKKGVIPEKRNYVINFRNTKSTKDVQVFVNEINIPFRTKSKENDFLVMFDNVDTTSKIFVYCKGKDIEINAFRVINEDLASIISDAKIETRLKEEIDKIIFSDEEIKEKRIKIRRLRRKGLDTIFVKMFIKLLEYMAEL